MSGNSDVSATPGTSSIAADASSCATSSDNDENIKEDYFDFAGDVEESAQSSESMPPEHTHEVLKEVLNEYGDETLSGSTTTKAAAIIMILAFVVAHGLPWETVDGLLRLINALFGFRGNVLPRSKYLLRKLWSCQIDSYVEHHYYCNVCGSCVEECGPGSARGESCRKDFQLSALKAMGCFFSIMNLKRQITQLISRFKNQLFNQMAEINSTLNEAAVTDITSASVYKSLRLSSNISAGDLTLTFNTDGSPVYKSSKTSVWPIQFVINELPPRLRQQNTVLAGLWFGPTHPDMCVFMEKFVSAVQEIGKIIWMVGTQTMTSSIHAICCSVDAPARAAVCNQTRYNGHFGCPWCLTCGEKLAGALRYRRTDIEVERTSAGVFRDMKLAAELAVAVNGMNGLSPLVNLNNFDIVRGQAVDYMHCILLGVTRQLVGFWLDSPTTPTTKKSSKKDSSASKKKDSSVVKKKRDSSASKNLFYIGAPSTVDKLDKRLLSICPPHSFTRLPRSLHERSFWKASEWRNWLLFFSLPTLLGILRDRYWRHAALLVEAVYTLLLTEISTRQLQHARHLLQVFVSRAEGLYGECFMTFNVHQLLHLGTCVENLGPLWACSAFPFESGNGRITKMVKAAKGAPYQIVERVVVHQELEVILHSEPLDSNVRFFCEQQLANALTKKVTTVDNIRLFGKPMNACLNSQQTDAVTRFLTYEGKIVKEFLRMGFKGTIIHSRQYKKAKKSDSSSIKTFDGLFFVIQHILHVREHADDTGVVLLVCHKLVIDEEEDFPPHIKECFFSPRDTCIVLTPCRIATPCLLMNMTSEQKCYVSTFPNLIERD